MENLKSICMACDAGKYEDSGTCQACPSGSNSPSASDDIAQCVCSAGFTGPPGGPCPPCNAGEYKSGPGSDLCQLCPDDSLSVAASDSIADCICNSGYGRDGDTCTVCDAGKYADSETCQTCPSDSDSPPASDGITACVCNAGFVWDGAACTACAQGEYHEQLSGTCQPCPSYGDSQPASTDITDCRCNEGYSGQDGDRCFPCPAGEWKGTKGSATCTACDSGSTSAPGSDEKTNCVCKTGFKGLPGGPCEACNPGYTGEGDLCVDINECNEGQDSCDPGATCYNLPGTYTCECNSGYVGDGFACKDVSQCAQCDPGFEMEGCTAVSDGSCVACEGGRYKATTGSQACSDCDADCPAGEEMVGCGGATKGQCVACGAGRYKTSAGTNACLLCTQGLLKGIDGGRVVEGRDVTLPTGFSQVGDYILHENISKDGYYTLWRVDSPGLRGPFQWLDVDFTVHTRVLFENLGGTEVTFVFLSGRERQEVCFDCRGRDLYNNVLVREGAWEAPFGYEEVLTVSAVAVNVWHDIAIARHSSQLSVSVDGVEVLRDPAIPFDFAVSHMGWRAWNVDLRIAKLEVSFHNLDCDAGFESDGGCGGRNAGECRECASGWYKAAGGTGPCAACGSNTCGEGRLLDGCGGDSAGECLWQETDQCKEETDNCDEQAVCSKFLGGFECSCFKLPGFAQDTDGTAGNCPDVNECGPEGAHNCDVYAACDNTDGSFMCACNAGYFGEGTVGNCSGLWTAVPDEQGATSQPPSMRKDMGVATSGTEVFIFGGQGTNGFLADLHRYDSQTGEWTELQRHGLAHHPSPRSQMGLQWFGGQVFVYAGRTNAGNNNDLYQCQVDVISGMQCTAVHTVGGTPPSARRGMGFGVAEDAILVYGGCCEADQDIHLFRIAAGTWMAVEVKGGAAPSARHSMGFALAGGRVLVLGGVGIESGAALGDLHAFDLQGGTWVELAPTVEGGELLPRGGMGVTLFGERLLVFGGEGDQGALLNDMWEYRPEENAWSPLPYCPSTPPSGRDGTAMVSANGELVIFGGMGEQALLGDMFTYRMVDPCGRGAHNCDEHAECTNTDAGSFMCTCLQGFSGNGIVGSCCDGIQSTSSPGTCWNVLDHGDMSFSEAAEACNQERSGRTLANIESQAEWNELQAVIAGKEAWVGLSRSESTLVWEHQDTSARPFAGAWKVEEPGAPGSGKACAVADNEGLRAENCELRLPAAVCARRPTPAQPSLPLASAGCDGDAEAHGKCWKAFPWAWLSREQAEGACEAWGGSVASVHTAAEMRTLRDLLADASDGSVWIGATRPTPGSPWEWDDGSTTRPWSYSGEWMQSLRTSNTDLCAKAELPLLGSFQEVSCDAAVQHVVCSRLVDQACDGEVSAHGKCWVLGPLGGVGTATVTYEEARNWCEAWSGSVASVRSAREQALVREMLGSGHVAAWIGRKWDAEQQVWVWEDGSRHRSWWSGSWPPGGEPGNDADGPCVMMGQDGLWKATQCGDMTVETFVCSKSTESWCDGDLLAHNKCWVAATDVSQTHAEAKSDCAQWGGALASVRSYEEQRTLRGAELAVGAAGGEAWIGISESIQGSNAPVWTWSDGAVSLESWWRMGNKSGTAQQCAATQGSDWVAVGCQEKRGLVCSKFKPADDSAPECNGDLHANGKCWLVVAAGRGASYQDGQRACEEWGGTLASIQDEREERDLLSIAGLHRFWIGLTRRSSREVWRWEDGTKRFLYPVGPPGVLQSSGQICTRVSLGGSGVLSYEEVLCGDDDAETAPQAVCSKYTDATVRVSTLEGSQCDGQMEVGGKCFYNIEKVRLGYHDALAACEEWGGTLTSIENANEEKEVTALQRLADSWIGLRRESSRRMWQWEDGAPRWRYPVGPPGTLVSSGEICASAGVKNGELHYAEGFCVTARDVLCAKQTSGQSRRVEYVSECDGQIELRGKCFQIMEKAHMTFDDATQACAEWNGTLASILWYEELGAIPPKLFGDPSEGRFWLGMRRENSSSIWKWEDGAPRFFNLAPPGKFEGDEPLCTTVSFSNDLDGLPIMTYSAEPCAEATAPDFVCSKFISGEVPRTLPNSNCDGQMNFGRCWIAHQDVYVPRQAAAEECRRWGGELASINDPIEALTVRRPMPTGPGQDDGLGMGVAGSDFWIGLQRQDSDGVFKWDYTVQVRQGFGWMPFPPIDSSEPVCVYESGRYGWWRDTNCSSEDVASFVCAKKTIPWFPPNSTNVTNTSVSEDTDSETDRECDGQVDDDKCWFFMADLFLGFDAAEAACMTWHPEAHIAIIESARDARQVVRMYNRYYPAGGGTWVGLRSAHYKQLWSWLDASNFNYANWGEAVDNERGRDALCAYTDYHGEWAATSCLTKQPHVVCVRRLDGTDAAPSRRSEEGLSEWCDGTAQEGSTCLWKINNPMTYDAGELACYQWGGSVAVPTSTGKGSGTLKSTLSFEKFGEVWIGLRRHCTASEVLGDCVWTWEDGEVLAPTLSQEWAPGEPAGPRSGKHCVHLGDEGWQTAECTAQVGATLCTKQIQDHCPSSPEGCASGGVTRVSSGCDCGCCFYFLEDSTELKREGECSPMCSTLKLTGQNVTALDTAVFEGLEHVRVLDLSDNFISELDDKVFAGASGISVLNLRNNLLTELREEMFSGLPVLVELDIRNNEVQMLANNSLGVMSNLIVLSLGSNQISSIEEGALENLTSLSVLDLNNNMIQNTESVHAPPNLTALFMERNRISALHESAFQGFQKVRYLQLSHNNIGHIARFAFVLLPELRALGLAFNKLTGVEYGKLTYLEHLLEVMLRANPLTCSPVLPDTVTTIDFITAFPPCLPVGCPQRLSEVAFASEASAKFSSDFVAEAIISGAFEMAMYISRRDSSQFLDNLSLDRGLYSDYGLGERCWCTPVARCFPTPILPCPPGTLGNPCRTCPVDHFCPGNNQSYPCPENTHAPQGGARACSCVAGYVGADGGSCELCPAGQFCPGGELSVRCPLHETSPEGSTEAGNCSCVTGFGRCQSTYHPSQEYGAACVSARTPALSWDESRAQCLAAGGDLLTITLKAEDAVARALADELATRVWFGLRDTQTEGDFLLPDGAPVAYFNWAPALPPLPQEDCVSFSAEVDAEGWHDDDCADEKPYLCALPMPAACEDVDECALALDKCDELRSVCNNTMGSFDCICVDGWGSNDNGVNCNINVDECGEARDNCHEQAECFDTDGSFECSCLRGWVTNDNAVTCIDIDECGSEEDNCDEDYAGCLNTPGSFLCACAVGWASTDGGVTCVDVDECNRGLHDCSINTETCVNNDASFTCTCRLGYSGPTCEVFTLSDCADECDPNARCLAAGEGSACICIAGFTATGGNTCVDIDECAEAEPRCDGVATCRNTNGSFVCECPRGFGSDNGGVDCYMLDECLEFTDNCDVNAARCTDNGASFTCACVDGWKSGGDFEGVNCTDIDECDLELDNCDRQLGQCRNSLGSFTCECALGWQSDNGGVNCSDIDECNDGSSCTGLEYCVNSAGSFECICREGYSRTDGQADCENIDECVEMTHLCDPNANCEDTVGGYNCNCNAGYFNPPEANVSNFCVDISECEVQNPCTGSQLCLNFEGGFRCICPPGFRKTSDAAGCEDIDECEEPENSTSVHACPSFSSCVNEVGSYTCKCNSGFSRPPNSFSPSCTNEDECELGEHSCAPNAECIDTVGSYLCLCTNSTVTRDAGRTCDTCYGDISLESGRPRPEGVRVNGYYCDCPVGRFGLFCEQQVSATSETAKTVQPGEEAAVTGDSAGVVLPLGALDDVAGNITISVTEFFFEPTIGAAQPELATVPGTAVVDFQPDGMRFRVPVLLTISVNTTFLSELSGKIPALAFWNTETLMWETMNNTWVNFSTGTAHAYTYHFSEWTCMTIDAPPCPATVHQHCTGEDVVDCPQGSFCPGGDATPQRCIGDEGTYCPGGGEVEAIIGNLTSMYGIICPAGFKCAGGEEPRVPCEISVREHSNPGASECAVCEAGQFWNTDVGECAECPTGYYGTGVETGTSGDDSCTACNVSEGAYCPKGSDSLTQAETCPQGFYCAGGTAGPASCSGTVTGGAVRGYYCPAGIQPEAATLHSTAGIACQVGYFCAGGEADRESCSLAPKGAYCPAGDTTEAAADLFTSSGIWCPTGFYCVGGQSPKASCRNDTVEGHYCPGGDSMAAANLDSTAGIICPEGFYCAGGEADAKACTSLEGNYCPEGFAPISAQNSSSRRSEVAEGIDPLSGTLCNVGRYCHGGSKAAVDCVGQEGTYCPAGFAPGAASIAEGSAGKRCAPGLYCPGGSEQPYELPPICEQVQSCGELPFVNETCIARQSTFYRHNNPPASFAVDGEPGTCIRTATARMDPNPQWVRVDLERTRRVRTVRFWSEGRPGEFDVLVTMEQEEEVDVDSRGGELPAAFDGCSVNATSEEGVLEALCPPGTLGRFVFVRRSERAEELRVCEVQVFDHLCLPPQEELRCPVGTEPAPCDARVCQGCVPCAPGTFSDQEGPDPCTPCPGESNQYGENPFSPTGSTSVFQCEGTQHLESTSSFAVASVAFSPPRDSWEIIIAFRLGWRIDLSGLAALFISYTAVSHRADPFLPRNFPCRSGESSSAGVDRSARLAETACCLADFGDTYATTSEFRQYLGGLDLVAANDRCDADDGSNMLRNAGVEVVPADGTVFVDTRGREFASSIRAELIDAAEHNDGLARAKITVPDAELARVSRPSGAASAGGGESAALSDSREMFIGLLDMLPTGTRVVDSSSRQVLLRLTRTQYGSFAAYGEQNTDFDFISYLNARKHTVLDPSGAPIYFAELSLVYGDGMRAADAARPVLQSTVLVAADTAPPYRACASLPLGFLGVALQGCAATNAGWSEDDDGRCPQSHASEDRFVRIYIPLQQPAESSLHVTLDLAMTDAAGTDATVSVSLELAAADAVTWCDGAAASVDLAGRVSASVLLGTSDLYSEPARTLQAPGSDIGLWPSGAATLQEGLVTLILELNETDDAGLEVFFEDVVAIHLNPGAPVDVQALVGAEGTATTNYLPTYKYDPETRDGRIEIPTALADKCPAASDVSESFFGCVHKHVLVDKEVAMERDAFVLGSGGQGGAADFMEAVLGSGTAKTAARALGAAFEENLEETLGLGARQGAVGLWLNPGHGWGGVVADAAPSLSQHLVVFVLYGVRSSAGTRRVLQRVAAPEKGSGVAAIRYNVDAAGVVEQALPGTEAGEWEVQMALDEIEACLSGEALRSILERRLQDLLQPYASPVRAVRVLSLRVLHADCVPPGSTRRAGPAPTAEINVVVALEAVPGAFIDWDALAAAEAVVISARPADNQPGLGALKGGTGGINSSQESSGRLGTLALALVCAAVGFVAAVVGAYLAGRAGRWWVRKRPSESSTPGVEGAVVLRRDRDGRHSSFSICASSMNGQPLLAHDIDDGDLSIEDLLTERARTISGSPLSSSRAGFSTVNEVCV